MNYKNAKLFLIPAIFFAVFFLTLFMMSDAASAATYIVAKDGTGNFKTIQEAANVAVAGDTVQVKAGTYNEWVSIKNSGSSGNPITFKATGTVTVTYPYGSMPSWSGIFWIKNKNYIIIDGFRTIGGYTGIQAIRQKN